MQIVSKNQVITEARNEFHWIKNSTLEKDEKLNELVDLRNYLTESYVMKKRYEDHYMFLQKVSNLITEIDQYWWKLFTEK